MRTAWILFAGLAALGFAILPGESDASFVSVGNNGFISTSPDGISWTPQTSGTTSLLLDVADGGGLYVAVGTGGKILTSPSGIGWTQQANPAAPYDLQGVGYGNGLFVAVGGQFTIVTSPNGIAWTQQMVSPWQPSFNLQDAAYGAGTWVAVGGAWSGGAQTPAIFTSTDAITWTPRDTGPIQSQLQGVHWDGSRWLAVGAWTPSAGAQPRILASLDAITWTDLLPQSGIGQFSDVTKIGGTWLITGSQYRRSTDLVSWNVAPSIGSTVATDGCIAVSESGSKSSTDLSTWTPQPNAPNLRLGITARSALPCAAPTCAPAAQTVVAGSMASFTASGGIPPYSWAAPGSSNPGPTSGSSFATSYPTAGTYTVTVAGSTIPSPPPSATCAVTVVAALACGPTTQSAVSGASTSFTSTGGLGSHSWSAPGGSPASGAGSGFSATFTSGTYTVTVSDAAPAQSATCSVNVVQALACSPGIQTIAVGDFGNLAATGGTGAYSWTTTGSSNNGPVAGSSFTAQFTSAGMRTVTLADGGPPGQTVTCTVQVNDPPPLVCTVYTPVVTVGDVAIFDAAGGTPAYGWTAPAGAPDTGAGPSFSTSYAAPGLQTVQVADTSYVTQSAGCPLAVAWPPLVCTLTTGGYAGSTLAFNATGGSGTYSWSAPSGDPATGSGASFATSFAVPGLFAAVVTSDTLVQTCMVVVANPPPPPPAPGLEYPGTPWTLPARTQIPPTPSIRIAAPCGATMVTLSGASSYDGDGLVVAWLWDFGGGARRSGMEIEHDFATTGIHPVQLTVVDDTGLTSSMGRDIVLGSCTQQAPVQSPRPASSPPAAPGVPVTEPSEDAVAPMVSVLPAPRPQTALPPESPRMPEAVPHDGAARAPVEDSAARAKWWPALLLPFAVAGLFYALGRRRRRSS